MANKQKDGIKASNQDFSKYDQVDKQQNYKLVEDDTTDEFDDEFKIQTCDMRKFFEGGPAGKVLDSPS